MTASIVDGWWTVSSGQYLGISDPGSDFSPNGDFSFFTGVKLSNVGVNHHFGGGGGVVGDLSWTFFYEASANRVQLRISTDGTNNDTYDLTVSLNTSDFYVFGFTFVENGTGASTVTIYQVTNGLIGSDKVVFATANGPVYQAGSSFYLSSLDGGDVYWSAYWDAVLSDAQIEDISDESEHPVYVDSARPRMVIDFHQAVAATYTADYGGQVFTVTGTPVHGGSSERTFTDEIGFGIILDEVDHLPWVANAMAKVKDVSIRPRPMAVNRGRGAIFEETAPFAKIKSVAIHPRPSAKLQGRGLAFSFEK